MNRDRENKSLQDKLKSFFKINKTNPANIPACKDFVLTDEILRDLGKNASATATRVRMMKDLTDHVSLHKLETNGVEKLWYSIQDMFLKEFPTDVRHATFSFLQAIIKGQFSRIDVMRAQFFRFIKHHDNPDDTAQCVDLLCTLTNNGKEVEHFEEEIGSFLLNWLPDVSRVNKLEEYLTVVNNIIKFNSPHLDEYIMKGYVRNFCTLCCNSNQLTIVNLSLEILSSIVAYSFLPHESLSHFVGTLCRTVNVECYCQTSWNIMKNLLGTHMGHAALFMMCRFLQEPSLKNEEDLMRGCVFFIHMALWGRLPMQNLRCPPSSVLPSILCAIKCNHPSIAYEVIVGLQRLIDEKGLELLEPTWDIILDILLLIIKQKPQDQPNKLIVMPLHNILNKIEGFIKVGTYNGSIKKFLCVIDECADDRPETSVLYLIQYLSNNIRPTETAWLHNLYDLLTNYYESESRTNVRLKVLDILSDVIQLYGSQYEDELIERVVIPHMQNIANDKDIVVRSAVAKLLISLCMDYNSKTIVDILDILEKLLMRPFDKNVTTETITGTVTVTAITQQKDLDFFDIRSLVSGLVQVFAKKIHRLPSQHATKIYKMFINYLEHHYQQPKIFEHCNQIRYLIFDCFMKMRADPLYHLGYPDGNGQLRFSSYLCVTYRNPYLSQIVSSPPQVPPTSTTGIVSQTQLTKITFMSIKEAFNLIIVCLSADKDWDVLKLILQELPNLLQNKSFVLSKHGNSNLNCLVNKLCALLQDKSLPDSLNVKVTRLDFQVAVVSALASFASYNSSLDQIHQQLLITTLTRITGTDPRNSKQCINALMVCTVDMREAAMKLLHDVLLKLSKISATNFIAIPILEYLSTLSQLPTVYTNFVQDQYMAVFAIALPYTNPFKYNHYIVSLAYHVISVWFLKCRLPFRRDFVKFIVSGLQTNVMVPFQEFTPYKLGFSPVNQDSSDRKRSSSLTEQSSRRKVRLDSKTAPLQQPIRDKTVLTFYQELNETCIDLMARYTYSPCSALPNRLPTAEFLLNGGITKSWMLGNKLITITTSGCTEKVIRHGVCNKCWQLCSLHDDSKIARFARSNSNNTSVDNSTTTTTTSSFLNRQSSSTSDDLTTTTSTSSSLAVAAPAPTVLSESQLLLDDDIAIANASAVKLPLLFNNDDNKDATTTTTAPPPPVCACWCQGWAEIFIRRPTGNVSWVMKMQNQVAFKQLIFEFPLNEITTLYMPSLYFEPSSAISIDEQDENELLLVDDQSSQCGIGNVAGQSTSQPVSVPGSPTTITKPTLSRQSSHDSANDEELYMEDCDDGTKSRNPVRRSNSSPEMANWKNPLIYNKYQHGGSGIAVSGDANIKDINTITSINDDQQQLLDDKKNLKLKDVRVSCEAIPEEISGLGTTPPSSSGDLRHHPSLLTCHSYPGSSPPPSGTDGDSTIPNTSSSKSYQTVSASPNQIKLLTNKSHDPMTTNNQSSFDTNLIPLVGKPPQSPTQTSPRLSRHLTDKDGHAIQKSSSSSIIEKNTRSKDTRSMEKLCQLDMNNLVQKRDRLHTISVMSTSSARKSSTDKMRQSRKIPKEILKSGLNPSFIFLQLYHSACFGNTNDVPLPVHPTKLIERAIGIIDLMYPYEIHKIGVIYVSEGQNNNEIEILKNLFGCVRYLEFLQNLGTLIRLADVDPMKIYIGSLDHTGRDGKYAYIHQDDLVCLGFHVATLMPNKDSDPYCTGKKAHIGNDNVVIVYNDSGEDFDINTIKSQVTLAYIIIEPLDYNSNKVTIKAKPKLQETIGCSEPIIVSDQSVSILVRQLALHADLAAIVQNSLRSHATDPYASTWLERLRKLKSLREKVIAEIKGRKDAEKGFSEEKDIVEDFTDFT